MRKPVLPFAFMALFLAGAGVAWLSADTPKVPAELQPPANEELLLQVHAKGDQIYNCKDGVSDFVWDPRGPEAQLFDKDDKPFGKHFAGPSWEANDGSRITAAIVNTAASPDANSIPWLLLKVTNHSGAGVLARVTSVQRLNTKGGKAPLSCDAAHVGQELRVSYSADYLFFAPPTK